MREDKITGKTIRCEYDSLADLADAAKRRNCGRTVKQCPDDWAGASMDGAFELARHGWHEQLDETLEVAESAIQMADQEHMVDTFNPVWDVTGAEVDVARYLSREPECMIDFPLSKTSKQGRVITLVAAVCYSATISTDTIIRRGQLITALALAITRLGHSVELWANNHVDATGGRGPAEVSVKVKGVDDEVDPAGIMYAYAHPSMLRRLNFAVMEGFPSGWTRPVPDGRMGAPMPPTPELYPEGAIFLPELKSDRDVPQADQFLKKYLSELGLLAE